VTNSPFSPTLWDIACDFAEDAFSPIKQVVSEDGIGPWHPRNTTTFSWSSFRLWIVALLEQSSQFCTHFVVDPPSLYLATWKQVEMSYTHWSPLAYRVSHLVIDNFPSYGCGWEGCEEYFPVGGFAHTEQLISVSQIIKRNPQPFAEYVTTSTCKGFNQVAVYITNSPEQFTISKKK